MPLTNLGEKQGCRFALWLVNGGVGLLALVFVFLGEKRTGPHGPDIRVRSQMKDLELSIKGYQTEYNRFPSPQSPPPTEDNTAGYDTTSAEGKKIIEALMGTEVQSNYRKIGFYDPPPAKKNWGGYTETGGLVDIWNSKGYIIHLDYDGDRKIANPEHPGATIEATVLVYSAGPDGDYLTWKDNVKSWER